MNRPLGGYKDKHPTSKISEPHLGITIDYFFSGRNFTPDGSRVSLLLCTKIYDHQENLYQRNSQQIILRKEVKEIIRSRIEDHLTNLGVDPVQRKGLLRNWELDSSKFVPYDLEKFNVR